MLLSSKEFSWKCFTNLRLSYIVEDLLLEDSRESTLFSCWWCFLNDHQGSNGTALGFVLSHGCAKDEFVYKPIEKLFTHYPQWVRRKQFRQEVTFCVVKMVLSSVYRKFSSKRLFILWIYSWLCDKFCGIEGNICFLSITRMRFFCLHMFLLQHCSRPVSSRWTRMTSTLASL